MRFDELGHKLLLTAIGGAGIVISIYFRYIVIYFYGTY